MRARTTDFIFDNGEFFVAKTNVGEVRVGMVGGRCFDLPESSPLNSVALAAPDAVTAEWLFDSCMDIFA